jgi:hypothetical protein
MKRIFSSILFAALLASCGTQTPSENVEGYGTMKRGSKDVIDQQHGKEMSYGAISGASDVNANGVAFLSSFEDGMSRIRVNVNIAVAEKGQQYEVSLRNNDTGKTMDIGTLDSLLGDVRHAMSAEIKSSLEGYTTILVHRTGKGVSPKIVAEGTLKKTK